MATPTKSQETQTKTEETPTTEPRRQQAMSMRSVPYAGVTVVKAKKKKKKRKKYSRGLRAIQELEVAGTKSSRRLTKALDRGLSTWITARNKSARKKRNGALRDSLKNSSKSMRQVLKQSSQAPTDFLDEFSKMKFVKNLFN